MTLLILYIVAPVEWVMRITGQESENNWDWIFQSSFAAGQKYKGESFRKVIPPIPWVNKWQERQLFSHTLFACLPDHILPVFPLEAMLFLFSSSLPLISFSSNLIVFIL